MSQTVFNTVEAVAHEGMIADVGMDNTVYTGVVNDTNGAVLFGRFVRILTAGNPPTVELPNATGEVTGDSGFGIVVAEKTLEGPGGTFAGHPDGAVIPVLRKGRIWVKSEDAVAAAPQPAFVRFTADANPIGGFRTDADTAEAVALPGARFLTNCGAGGLTLLELQIPVS
jgi:hypothetical protein